MINLQIKEAEEIINTSHSQKSKTWVIFFYVGLFFYSYEKE